MTLNSRDHQLNLLIPGLLQPLPDWCRAGADPGRFPALETLLAKSQRAPFSQAQTEMTLWQLLSEDSLLGRELPQAQQVRGGAEKSVCADLVHIRADLSDLFLIDAAQLNITAAELQIFSEEINAYLADVGASIQFADNGRGILNYGAAPALASTPLRHVDGRGMNAYLPTGESARWWHAFMNDMQMLLHSSAVNKQRELAGKPVINGLWCWGGGYEPVVFKRQIQAAYCHDAEIAALLKAADITQVETIADCCEADVSSLVVINTLEPLARYQDYEQWLETLSQLEQSVFSPALQALKNKRIHTINLYSADGEVRRMGRAQLYAFWKPRRALKSLYQ